jgi:hypothetical protein
MRLSLAGNLEKPPSKGPNSGSLAVEDVWSGRIVVKCDTGQALPSRIGGLPVLEYKAGGHLLPHSVPGCLVKPDTEPLALCKKIANFSGCTQFSRNFCSFTYTTIFCSYPARQILVDECPFCIYCSLLKAK